MTPLKIRDYLWYVLPLLLGVIGGLIAYFVLRHRDPWKAKACLGIGIAITAVSFAFAALVTL